MGRQSVLTSRWRARFGVRLLSTGWGNGCGCPPGTCRCRQSPANSPPPHYIGPFKIVHRINSVTVRLQLPCTMRVHLTFHVSRLKPVLTSVLAPAEVPPPGPRLVGGQPVYTVHRILADRRVGRGRQYLVNWEGYGPVERCWVPAWNILDSRLIANFRRRNLEGSSGAAL